MTVDPLKGRLEDGHAREWQGLGHLAAAGRVTCGALFSIPRAVTSHLYLGIVHRGIFTPQPLANATDQDFGFFSSKEPVSQYRAEATFPVSARIQASATVPALRIALDSLDFWPSASSHFLFAQGSSAANACWRNTWIFVYSSHLTE